MLGATLVDTLIVPVTFCIVEKLAAGHGKSSAPKRAGESSGAMDGPGTPERGQ